MNRALENYFDEFITLPEYDLQNPISQQQFFQEGGFARFFPVNPGGYQAGPIAPNMRAPQLDDHALWNSVAGNLTSLGQIGIQNRHLGLQRDRFAYQKTQDVVDNKYKELQYQLGVQQLEQRKAEFQVSSVIDKVRLMHTIQDSFVGLEVLPEDVPIWGEVLKDSKIAEAQESGDIEAIGAAYMKGMSDKRTMQIVSNVKKRDNDLKNLETLVRADPNIIKFVDGNILMNEGKVVIDTPGYTTYKTQQQELDKLTQEYNNELIKEKTVASQISRELKGAELKEHLLGIKVLESNLTGDPKKDLEAWQTFNSKAAAKAAGRVATPQKYTDLWLLKEQGYYTDDQYLQAVNQRIALENTHKQSYTGLNPDGTPVVTNQLGTELLKSMGNNYFRASPLNPAARGMLEVGVNQSIGDFTFKSKYPEKDTPVLDASLGNAFIPAQGYYNQDGSYTVKGTLFTNDKSLRNKLDRDAQEVKSPGEIAGYSAFETDDTIYKISTSFTVDPQELGLPPTPWITQTPPSPINNSIGNKANVEYITPRANDFLSKVAGGAEALTGAKHHLEKGEAKTDTIDIGLGSNKYADDNYKLFNSPKGRELLVDEGYMALHEVPKGQKPKYAIDYNSNPLIKPFENPSSESTGEHLHTMPVDGRITTLAGDTTPYKISYSKTENEYGELTPSYTLESENNQYTIVKQTTGEYAIFTKDGWYLRSMSAEGMARMLGKSQRPQ